MTKKCMLKAYPKVPQMPNKLFDPSTQSAKLFGTILKKDNSQKMHHDLLTRIKSTIDWILCTIIQVLI